MELMLVWRVLRRWWWLILIPTAIAGVFAGRELLSGPGASGGFTSTVRYSAAQVLQAIPGRDGDFQDVWLASELTVNALTDWVRSSSFRVEVQQMLDDTPGIDLSGLGVAADNKRSVGLITLSYGDAVVLEDIVSAAIDVLKTRAQAYFPQLGGEPAQVTILDTPVVTPAPPPITNRLGPLIRVALALLGGVVLAFLAEYLDPTIRRRDQVEALGVQVLGSLPKR